MESSVEKMLEEHSRWLEQSLKVRVVATLEKERSKEGMEKANTSRGAKAFAPDHCGWGTSRREQA